MPEDRVIFSKWPERDRWALREMITELLLPEEPVCDDCLQVFAVRLFGGARPIDALGSS